LIRFHVWATLSIVDYINRVAGELALFRYKGGGGVPCSGAAQAARLRF